jgi:hypothetical protein
MQRAGVALIQGPKKTGFAGGLPLLLLGFSLGAMNELIHPTTLFSLHQTISPYSVRSADAGDARGFPT